ncbi:MAG: glycosyltransferase family 4 protein [Ignavibacteriales bacterium]
MKVAIVHEWFESYAGSEKVLEQMLEVFPDADLYSLVDFLPEGQRDFIRNKKVNTTFVQKLPFAHKKFRSYLPIMHFAMEQLDMRQYDLIISNNHAIAKNVITGPDQLHISYIHSPIRYAWDLQHQYLRESGLNSGIKGLLTKYMLHKIRHKDLHSVNGVDEYLCNSRYIARRVWKLYKRKADVIYPPVDVDSFKICSEKDDYYFTASRMVPYKKMDLIVEAFSGMPDKKLIVIGDGPEFNKVKSKAKSNVELLGYQSTETIIKYMQKARAFVFAAEEDFGITPVEAQACGTPVLAFGKGGVTETVENNVTGLFYDEQNTAALIKTVEEFEKIKDKFDPVLIRKNAERFHPEYFRQSFRGFVDKAWKDFSVTK